MATQTIEGALAGVMELENRDDREEVMRMLFQCNKHGIWLDADDVRKQGLDMLRELLAPTPRKSIPA